MNQKRKMEIINLISENRFQELKEKLCNWPNGYAVHRLLFDVLHNNTVEIAYESFDEEKYQKEYFEGLDIYLALEESALGELQLKEYRNAMVLLAFKMGSYTRAKTSAIVRLLDPEEISPVKRKLREKLQDFITLLKKKEDESKAIANLSVAKAQISNSMGSMVEKYEIGADMLQFAESYENIGETEIAVKIYQGIMTDFECSSAKAASGLLPEINHIDDRPESEIIIFEKAKNNFERLTGQKVQEPKRIRI